MLLDDLPNDVEMEMEVAMRSDVPKAVDRAPADLGMALLEVTRELAGSFRESLQRPENSVLDIDVAKECVTIPVCAPFNQGEASLM